jgi:hypothetical protein
LARAYPKVVGFGIVDLPFTNLEIWKIFMGKQTIPNSTTPK